MKTVPKKVICWFIESRKQRETFQMLMFLRANKTPEKMGSNEKECPPAPKKPKSITGVFF